MERGEIYIIDFPVTGRHEQGGVKEVKFK